MPVFAQEPVPVGVIWQDRGDAAALDLVGGPGGKDHEPGTNFTFIEEIGLGGTSPKFEVGTNTESGGRSKLGEEAQSETAATRLLWAAGYLVDEIYYRPRSVSGLPGARSRAGVRVGGDGVVTGVRLERDSRTRRLDHVELVRQSLRRHTGVQRPAGDDGAHQQLGSEGRQQSASRTQRRTARATSITDRRRHIRAHRQRHHPQQERREGLRGDDVHRGGHGEPRRFRVAEPPLLSHSSCTSRTTAPARAWSASSKAFRSPMRDGSATASGSCRSSKSATVSAPADSATVRHRGRTRAS